MSIETELNAPVRARIEESINRLDKSACALVALRRILEGQRALQIRTCDVACLLEVITDTLTEAVSSLNGYDLEAE